MIGAAVAVALAVAPWVFMVHAKLAVIASQLAAVCQKLERSAETSQRLWEIVARHEARLETHDVQIAHISQRLEEY
jgi:hypothetical protein